MAASSVNGFDAMASAGYLAGMLPHTYPAVLGKDYAGTVEQLGAAVSGLAVGDEVFGTVLALEVGKGTIAEHAVVPVADGLARRPDGLGVAEAGVLGLAGVTAVQAIAELGLRPGETVLVGGAAGGVGSLAVQLAAAAGAQVVASTRNRDHHQYLTSLGADNVVVGSGDLAAQVRELVPDGVDAALHLAGDVDAVAAAVRDEGRLSTPAAQLTPDAYADRGLSARAVMGDGSAAVLDRLAGLVVSGELRVPIDRTYALAEADQGLTAFAEAKNGKIAVRVG